MAITEAQRHRMYLALERELGTDEAATLMEHLPPVGWADVATKRDLEQLEVRMNLRFGAVDHKIDGAVERIRVEVSRDLRSQLLAIIAANTTLAGFAIAALRF